MKVFRAVIIVALLFLMPAYAFCDNFGYMRISLISGDVQIKTPDSEEWGLASINGPLEEGDQVWVPDGGRVELQLNTGTYIRLDQNSALQVLSMDKDSSQFYLSQGYAYVYYDALSDTPRGSVIQVDTPDASVRAFDRAIFRIDMPDQYTDVAVYKGYVEAENKVGVIRVNAGQMLSLAQNTSGEVSPMGPPDEWEDWNRARNNRVLEMRGESSRYLPPELRAYSYDFDAGGRWVQDPDYGYVWIPTAGVGPSWAPYREGRWIWRGGAGVVEAVGDGVDGFAPGDPIAVDPNILCGTCSFCRRGEVHLCKNLVALGVNIPGGFAEYCVVPVSQAYKIPKSLPLAHAALAEPVACCLRGVDLAEIISGDRVVIFGAGPMGAIILQLARMRGASHVILIDPQEGRRKRADALGASWVLDPARTPVVEAIRAEYPDGIEVVFDCSGNVTAVQQALGLVMRGGTLMLYGVCPKDRNLEDQSILGERQ